MNVTQLGQQVKAKYPQYSNMSDFQVGLKVLQKYPQYENKITDRSELEEFGIGAGKGIISSLTGLSSLGEQAIKALGRLVTPKSLEARLGFQKGKSAAEEIVPEELRTPTSGAQRLGFGAEQFGEFFTPGGAISKGTKAIKGAVEASKIGKVEKVAARLAGRAGLEATTYGGVTAYQTGGDLEEIEKSAMLSALFPLGGELVNFVGKPLKKFLSSKVAPRLIDEFIKPVSSAFRFNRDPGRTIATEGLVARNIEKLSGKIVQRQREVGKEIEKVLTQPGVSDKRIDISLLLSPIENGIKDAVESGEQALVSRLQNLRDGLTKTFKEEGGKLIQTGDKNLLLSPLEAQQFKIRLGKQTKWTGQAFDGEVNQVRRQLYQKIDKAIDDVVPDIRELNERWAGLLTAEKAVEHRIDILKRNNVFGLGEGLVAKGSVVGSLATGNLAILASGFATAFGSKFLRSTAVRTQLASLFVKLSAEERNTITAALPIFSQIFKALGITLIREERNEEVKK